MRVALFNNAFHARMSPKPTLLAAALRFKGSTGKGATGGCFGDGWLGPDWLSAEDINGQLPEMPNKLPNDANCLHYEEPPDAASGQRTVHIEGYVTTTLCKEPRKVLGCLRFSLHLSHQPQKHEMTGYIELDGVCVHPSYRRRHIALIMGVLGG